MRAAGTKRCRRVQSHVAARRRQQVQDEAPRSVGSRSVSSRDPFPRGRRRLHAGSSHHGQPSLRRVCFWTVFPVHSGANLMCADGCVPRVRRLAASTSAPRRIASCREPWQLQRQPLPETTARWEFACGWPPQKKPQRHRARSRRMLICPARCAPLRSRRTSGPAWLLRPDTLGQKEEWCDSACWTAEKARAQLFGVHLLEQTIAKRRMSLGGGGGNLSMSSRVARSARNLFRWVSLRHAAGWAPTRKISGQIRDADDRGGS